MHSCDEENIRHGFDRFVRTGQRSTGVVLVWWKWNSAIRNMLHCNSFSLRKWPRPRYSNLWSHHSETQRDTNSGRIDFRQLPCFSSWFHMKWFSREPQLLFELTWNVCTCKGFLDSHSMHWDPVDGSRQDTFVYISIRVTHYYAKGDSDQRQDSELGKLIAESCSDVIESRGRAKNGKTTCFARLLPYL